MAGRVNMDEIRRKLELIDAQLAGGNEFHSKIISTAPLLFAAVGLICGIAIQEFTGLPVFVWSVLLLCSVISIVVFCLIKRTERLNAVAYLTLICFACLGGIRLTHYYQPRGNDIRNFVGDERSLASIRGLIITEPYINRNDDWEFSRFSLSDAGSSFYLKVDQIESVDGWAKVSGTVRVQVGTPVLDLKAGDYVQMHCQLGRFGGATNPGQFDIARYLARKNVFVAASADSRDAIKVLQNGSADFFVKIKRTAKQIAVRSLLGSSSAQDESERLLQALVLGYRAGMDIATYEAFRRTGLLHFVCLSGMNFGIFVGMIWWLCKTAGLTRKTQASVCIIATGVFVLAVPPNPPAFRAAIICLVFCLSFFFRRQPSRFNSLALAAIILLLMIKPTELFEVSWQLSFASVLGILLFTDRIHFFIYEKITDIPWWRNNRRTTAFFRIVSRPGPYILNLFSIALSAWLGSAGILLYNFYTIRPLTSIWTVVASPLIAVISSLGYLKLLTGLVLPTAASLLDLIIKPLSGWLIELVKYIAQRDFSQVLIGHITVWLIVFYYCTILFTAFIHLKRPLLKRAISVLMIFAVLIFLGITKWQRTYRDDLVMTCLYVGHGQAIVAELPGGDNILLDAGSLYNKDIGRQIVSPFLDYHGISEIGSIIISHNDVDHINGILEVVRHCKVDGVYANDAFFTKADNFGTAKFLRERLGVYWPHKEAIRRLEQDFGADYRVRIRVLWPSGQVSDKKEELSDNNQSLVLMMEFVGRKVLLCSDIEKFAQAELFRIYPDLKVDIVVVAHHGSTRTSDAGFLEKLGSDISIVSCGQRDYERQQTVRAKNKAKLFYTARDGAITVRVGKNGSIESKVFVK